MEEKKTINVRLSTAILVIIILALIGGLVYFVLQNKDLKKKQLQSEIEMQSLQNKTTAEIQDLQSKAQELQKTIDEIRNITSNTEENKTPNASTQNTDSEKQQYVGIYKNKRGDTVKIAIDNNGELYFEGEGKNYKIDLNNKKDNGYIVIYEAGENEFDASTYLYPVGVEDEISKTKDKVRILLNVGSDFSLEYSVCYKVD